MTPPLGSGRTIGNAPTTAPGASGGLRHLDDPWPVRDENPEARALLPARRRLPLAPRTGLEGAVVAVVVVGHPADDRAGAEDDPRATMGRTGARWFKQRTRKNPPPNPGIPAPRSMGAKPPRQGPPDPT